MKGRKTLKKFKKIYIEITNVCNLACSFCPQTKRKPMFMSLETFEKILKEIKGYTQYIYFHVKGEPLLHPEIDKFLDLSFQYGFKVNITSNGTLINNVKDKIIAKPALRQINLSLHSFYGSENIGVPEKNSEENLEENSEEPLKEYLQGIFKFTFEALEKSNIIIAYRLWNLDKGNASNIDINKNSHIIEALENAFDLDYKIEDKLIKSGGIKLSERVYLNQDYEFKWPGMAETNLGKEGFCYGLRTQAAILADGTVVPCCLDGEGIIDLGNIKEKSFSEIIEGERANKIFDGFSNRQVVEELCQRCGFRQRFQV